MLATAVLCLVASRHASADSVESIMRRALAAQQSGDTPTAIRLYKEVLAERPELGQVRSNLGAALVSEGRFPEAIEQYELALKGLPSNPSIILNLALAYYKLGRYQEAAEWLERIQPNQPENLQVANLLASCWNELGQSAKVIDLLTPVERAHPEDRGIAFLLGTALLNQERPQSAEVVLNRILGDGGSAEAQLLLGATKLRSRDFNAAIEYLERAAKLNPKLPFLHSYYGRALMATGNTPAATAEFRAELQQNPYDFFSNLSLAMLLKQEDKLDEALPRVDAALRVRPDDPGALYQLASIHILLGKNEQALAELERITKQSPNFTEAQVSLATVYYRLKRTQDGDRVRAVVRKLQEEEQNRQPGNRGVETAPAPVKRP